MTPISVGKRSVSCFNPHTHAGCDENAKCRSHWLLVSIHTPTQGVTQWSTALNKSGEFQSTHPRRVWRYWVFERWLLTWFQSTHPRRVWLNYALWTVHFAVSIHTPTQGVTQATYDIFLDLKVSIHTPTQGVTTRNSNLPITREFQSTHPRRVWPSIARILFAVHRFNPHTHAGCDGLRPREIIAWGVSIHTPTQGVTRSCSRSWTVSHVSIHTPTQGVTFHRLIRPSTRSFNPHTHAGCDRRQVIDKRN